jgi:hypothetical protein
VPTALKAIEVLVLHRETNNMSGNISFKNMLSCEPENASGLSTKQRVNFGSIALEILK